MTGLSVARITGHGILLCNKKVRIFHLCQFCLDMNNNFLCVLLIKMQNLGKMAAGILVKKDKEVTVLLNFFYIVFISYKHISILSLFK